MRFDAEARRAARPTIVYDESLPVTLRREEIAAAILQHQVVIVCGETGSGKTTQLPKICLELGRGLTGLIGHTQPRRIAARATATRIAQELKSELGRYVGFKIRFTDRVSPETYIKLMTDGILLAETQTDPLLRQYDTLIIDEAHERSLNIDFMLGYLKQLLPRRPDLKVIVTSATLDAERFSQHFSSNEKAAPVIEVSGRLYPIETRYRPWSETTTASSSLGGKGASDGDINEAIVDAVGEAHRAGPGDVLVFLPGEREIREVAEALRKHSFSTMASGLEILPLFARQSAAEQARVFSSHQGRRVVLATNVAETSLTVPGIRYVIDTGLARVKRYSHRNKIEQLQVEPIARAAANQRAGRCGRVSAGICFRLYAEDDFNKRAAYTEPEILRSSLAGVILRMKSLHLGDVESFPFLEAPVPRMIADGYQLLAELGAIDETTKALTKVGVELAKLPLDPKIGRMIIAAREQGCLHEMLIIASALSVQDPRDRPQEQAGSADQAHAKWKDEKSEFLAYLKLWQAADMVWKHETSNKQRQWCRQNFLSWLRMREWRDVHAQLLTLCHEHGWQISSAYMDVAAVPEKVDADEATALQGGRVKNTLIKPLHSKTVEQNTLSSSLRILAVADGKTAQKSNSASVTPCLAVPRESAGAYAAIHKALLSGLLGHIGLKSEEDTHYLGARGIKFFIHPGSSLIKKAGRWIVAAEIVETSRLFARCVARIEPEWLEQVGAHLLRSHIYDPHWEKGPGQVVAWERVTLHGLLLHARRRVHYGPLDKKLSREILIRSALVEGEVGEDWVKKWRFFQHNAKLMQEIETLEHKSRRPDVLVDDELIYAFYDAVVTDGITTLAAFDRWRREAEAVNPKRLFLEKEQLMRHEAAGITTAAFPPYLEQYGQKFALHYHHQPGAPDDGVTLDFPLVALNQISAQRCEWLVPGLLKEKVAALLKTLPQKYRHRLQPLDGFADDFCATAMPGDEALLRALIQAVEEKLAMKLPLDAFRLGELRPHLFMNFRLLNEHGGTLAISRHLTELRTEYRDRVAQIWQDGVAGAVKREVISMDDASTEKTRGDTAALPVKPPADDEVLYGDWLFGPLPELLEVNVKGRQIMGFPALVDEIQGVRLTVFDTQERAQAEHRRGLMRLFSLQLATQVKAIEKLPGLREVALQFIPLGSEKELKAQLVAATLERTCLMAPLPLEKSAFVIRCDAARGRMLLVAQEIARLIATVIGDYAVLQKKIAAAQKTLAATCADINAQLAALLHKNFIVGVPYERLQHYPRYLKAATLRLDKARSDPLREARLLAEWQTLGKPWGRERHALQKSGQASYVQDTLDDPFMEEFRWLLEELRVALFAQELRTPTPVSVKRLQKMWDARMR
ncbi:MAG: ATP-dependent RNA helicase HrpA [Rugosibacter sp.]|nr:ATP-dependent RNA helicase HrpA [Rugosibacter sp.]